MKDSGITGLLNERDLAYLQQRECIEPSSIQFTKEGPYGCFSNFYPQENPIVYHDISYPTNEHFFQAMKTLDASQRKEIAALDEPKKAKFYCSKKANKIVLRSDWEQVKYSIMYWGVKEKFTTNKFCREMLLSTDHKQIIEWTWWGDEIWGMNSNTGIGNNALGKILKMIRDTELATG